MKMVKLSIKKIVHFELELVNNNNNNNWEILFTMHKDFIAELLSWLNSDFYIVLENIFYLRINKLN